MDVIENIIEGLASVCVINTFFLMFLVIFEDKSFYQCVKKLIDLFKTSYDTEFNRYLTTLKIFIIIKL